MLNREITGRRLIYFAWGVEIVAASIGLTIAALVIYSTAQNIGAAGADIPAPTVMDMFLGGLPFIVVAIVELTKIPLATACYTAVNRWWKAGFSFALILLSIITFETILNGFERNFTQRTYLISTLKKALTNIEERITKNTNEIAELSQTTEGNIRASYSAAVDQIEKEKQTALEDIVKEEKESKFRYGGEAAKVKNQRLETVQNDLKQLDAESVSETADINKRYEFQLKQVGSSIGDKQKTLRDQIQSLEQSLSESRKLEERQIANVKDTGGNAGSLEMDIERIRNSYSEQAKSIRADIQKTRTDLAEQISKTQTRLNKLESELQKRLDEAHIFTDEKALRRDFGARITAERNQLESLKEKLNQSSFTGPVQKLNAEKDQQIARLREDYAERGSQGTRERASIREVFAARRLQDEEQRRNLQNELAALTTNSQRELATTKRDDEFGRLKERIDKKRKELLNQRFTLSEEIEQILLQSRSILEPVLNRINERRTSVIQSADRRQQDQQKRNQEDLEKLAKKRTTIEKTEAELVELRNDKARRREEIGRQAQNNQIYRITALWSGKDSPADITNDELRVVTIVWFGSLAAITAWTGTVLAFGGLVVLYGPQQRLPRKPQPVRRALRSLFIDWRRRVRKPIIKEIEKEVIKIVEVVKEIPVDKVVFKEVPVEVVRKELVYVPMFTDDPNLLREQKVNLGGEGAGTNGADKEV